MSERFSFTTMTSAATMLNAATATTSMQDQAHHRLLDADRAEVRRVLLRSSRAPWRRRPTAAATAAARRRRAPSRRRSAGAGRRPRAAARAPRHPRAQPARARRRAPAGPTSNTPATVKVCSRGRPPELMQFAARHHDGDLVADCRRRAATPATRPRMMRRSPGTRSASRPCTRWRSTSETPASAAGSRPCSSTGCRCPARPIIACTSANGATPDGARARRAPRSATASQSLHQPRRALERRMRGERDQPAAQFALEAVHHRDDGDQRRDADGHAQHRHPGDERDEEALPPGPDVAQADEDGQRMEHRAARAKGRKATRRRPSFARRRRRARGCDGGAQTRQPVTSRTCRPVLIWLPASVQRSESCARLCWPRSGSPADSGCAPSFAQNLQMVEPPAAQAPRRRRRRAARAWRRSRRASARRPSVSPRSASRRSPAGSTRAFVVLLRVPARGACRGRSRGARHALNTTPARAPRRPRADPRICS